MERNCELRHFGIKGQKWGVRRWQNEDGTLTEEGKAHYMTAARSGKLNYKKLSNADLDMINQRFAKEANYKKNVDAYRSSLVSTKIKKAATNAAVSGAKGLASGGKGIAGILAKPISDALKDAFKFDSGSSGKGSKNNDKSDGGNESPEDREYRKYLKDGHKWLSGYKEDPRTVDNVNRGRNYIENQSRTFAVNANSGGRMGTSNTSGGAESVLRNRYKSSHTTTTKPQKSNVTRQIERERKEEERAAKSGIIIDRSGRWSGIQYRVTRVGMDDDELMHFGIKGQRWGIRRFENEDGTLTEAGKKRYNKYQSRADGYAKQARNDNYFRKEIESAGKKYVSRDNSWRKHAEWETKEARAAIKNQDKANRFLPDSEKKDMRSQLQEQGIETDRYNPKALRKADADVNKAVLKSKNPWRMTDKEVNDIFEKSLDESQAKKTELSKNQQEADTVKSDKSIVKTYKDKDTAEEYKKAYDDSIKSIRDKGMMNWWSEHKFDNQSEMFFDYMFKKNESLMDKWYEDRDNLYRNDNSGNAMAKFDNLQIAYCKKLANQMGLPQTRDTYYYLKEWVFNGDD